MVTHGTGNPRFIVRYHASGEAEGEQSEFSDLVSLGTHCFEDEVLKLIVEYAHGVISVKACPKVPIELDECRIDLTYAPRETDRIFINGWQSWSLCEELGPWDTQRGISQISRSFVEHYSMDACGDYSFSEYSNKAGCSHGYSYGYLRRGDTYYLCFSLNEDKGLTAISVDTRDRSISAVKELPLVSLEQGGSFELMRVCIAIGECDFVFSRAFELLERAPRRALAAVGCVTSKDDDVTQDCVLGRLEASAEFLKDLDTSNLTKLFLIGGPCGKVGDWTEPSGQAFPSGLESVSERIASLGFVPGIWIAPFVCELSSKLMSEHPDWLLTDEAGNAVKAGPFWSGVYALDTLDGDVREHVRRSISVMTAGWGFKLIKADFLYAACMHPHGGMNRGELLADALGLIREAAGDDVALYASGLPLAAAFGRVEYCGVSAENSRKYTKDIYQRLVTRERPSSMNNVANIVWRQPLDRLAFRCVPDSIDLCEFTSKAGTNALDMVLGAASCMSGMMLFSSDLGLLDDAQRIRLEEAVAMLNAANA